MKFNNIPDTDTAINMLKEIAAQSITVGPQKVDKPLALYGAGELGHMAKEYFDKLGIKIEYVVDIRADYWRKDDNWEGTQIVFPEEISLDQKKNHLLAVCIATIPFTPLSDNLYRQGWNHVVPFYDITEAYRNLHPLSNGWFAKPFDSNDIDNISKVLEIWGDDISRAHHLQFIAWRLIREEWVFEKALVNTENRYFIPKIIDAFSDNDSFADVGAHYGNVTLRFMDVTKGNFEMICMIEPDPTNLKMLRSQLAKFDQDIRRKIQVFPYVVGKKKEKKLFYEGLGYVSQLSDIGNTQMNVTTIDDMDISPSYIKIHLEGGELTALQGAKDTILKHRPIISVTSYHNDEGIYKLPMWLMMHLNDYQYFMRLHSWCGTGAVVYAIPCRFSTLS